MGDLKGHILPGSLFLMYGLWWAFCGIKRYLVCRQAGTKYISSATFPCPLPCGRLGAWPLEGIVKIVLPFIGMLGEIYFNLPHPSSGIVQHVTMYFFFLLSGVVDVVICLGVPLPPGTDYISVALAFLVEGLLFANHLHDREILDVSIHLLLVYVVFLTVVVILLETRFQRSILLTLSRSYLLMLQGSWFLAVGIILYGHGSNSKAWDLTSHMDVMQASIYFSWHCATHFIVLLLIASAMSCCYRQHNAGPYRNGSDLPMTVFDKSGEQVSYRMLTSHDEFDDEDEDDRIEFDKSGKTNSRTS